MPSLTYRRRGHFLKRDEACRAQARRNARNANLWDSTPTNRPSTAAMSCCARRLDSGRCTVPLSTPASTSSPRSQRPSMGRASARSWPRRRKAAQRPWSLLSASVARRQRFRFGQRVHDGAIGDICTLFANDYRGPIWVKPCQPSWSDTACQMRNWYYFTWLSGDFNVEQHVRFPRGRPRLADGQSISGREHWGWADDRSGTGPEYGQIFDHFSVA